MSFDEWLIYIWRSLFFPKSPKTLEWKMLRILNKERKSRGLDVLRVQPDLRTVARKHSQDMASKDYFSHKNKKGQKAADRLKVARITDVAAGENLAKIGGEAYPVEVAHDGLMKSAGHRKNILNKKYNCVGIGVVRARSGIFYFTQVFAQRELLFVKKVGKKARMNSGLRLKGKSFVKGASILYQLKSRDFRGVCDEDVLEVEGRDFDFRLFVEDPGWYQVALYFSPTGRGQFYLVNEFEVKFTYWW